VLSNAAWAEVAKVAQTDPEEAAPALRGLLQEAS
jgi:hypothetical protein